MQMQTTCAAGTPRKSQGRAASKGFANPIDQWVGHQVRLIRARAGLSMAQVAEATGVTYQQQQKYERGQNRIAVSRLFDLARVCGVDVTAFFEGMPADVKAATPGVLYAQGAVEKVPMIPLGSEKDPEAQTHTRHLVRVYAALPKPVQDSLRRLINVLAREHGQVVEGD